MDYGALLSRTWEIVWNNKFLILLGVLVALGTGSGTGASGGSGFNVEGPSMPQQPPRAPEFPDMPRWRGFENFRLPALPAAAAILLIGLILVVGLSVWVVSTIAKGGLIAGADTLAGGGQSSFGSALSAGWRRGWTLLGIAIIPGIPALILALGVLFVFLVGFGIAPGLGESVRIPLNLGVFGLLGLMGCLLTPLIFVLSLLQTFANRACMLEQESVFGAYKRGLNVIFNNIGPVLVLFLIQIVLNIALGLVMILPGILIALCCILWPLLLLIRGAIAAYFSTMWTLAWREWTLPTPVS
jgi:hypothetical protein